MIGFHNMGSGAWVLMSIGMVAFWALVVWLIVASVRGRSPTQVHNQTGNPADSAEQILTERYARGEIESDDYHQRLADIRGRQLSGSPQ